MPFRRLCVQMLVFGCLLSLGRLCQAAQSAPAARMVYQNDFSTGADGGVVSSGVSATWSTSLTSVTPSGRYGRFLGEFGQERADLTLAGLPQHSRVTLSFDLFIMKSWDGNQVNDPFGFPVGPDVWILNVLGLGPLLQTTFSNIANFSAFNLPNVTYPQAYPQGYPGSNVTPRSGAAEVNTLGYTFAGYPMDAVYRQRFSFYHSGSTLQVNFLSTHLSPIFDESWGLDNVRVEVEGGPPQTPPGLEKQVPFLEMLITKITREAGDIVFTFVATNTGGHSADFSLISAELIVRNPLGVHFSISRTPDPLGDLKPGESTTLTVRYPGSVGPPGAGATLILDTIGKWPGNSFAAPTLRFVNVFDTLTLP